MYFAPKPLGIQSSSEISAWRRFLSKKMGMLLTPFTWFEYADDFKPSSTSPKININTPKICTYDGAQLETIEIEHAVHKRKDISQQNYVIYFGGNGKCARDSFNEAREHVKETQHHAIVFSYRGTGGRVKPPKLLL